MSPYRTKRPLFPCSTTWTRWRDASAQSPAPAIVLPHGGPTSLYADEWDGHVQCLVDRGFAVIAPNFRGSISYGRAFERLNHGDWGVGDTRDCLAAADFLRTLESEGRVAPLCVAASGGSARQPDWPVGGELPVALGRIPTNPQAASRKSTAGRSLPQEQS